VSPVYRACRRLLPFSFWPILGDSGRKVSSRLGAGADLVANARSCPSAHSYHQNPRQRGLSANPRGSSVGGGREESQLSQSGPSMDPGAATQPAWRKPSGREGGAPGPLGGHLGRVVATEGGTRVGGERFWAAGGTGQVRRRFSRNGRRGGRPEGVDPVAHPCWSLRPQLGPRPPLPLTPDNKCSLQYAFHAARQTHDTHVATCVSRGKTERPS